MKQETKNKEPELLVNDAHGQYIPQIFCQQYKPYITNFEKVKDDFEIVLKGVDEEFYWDAWDDLLNNMEVTNDKGEKVTIGYLPESCDLWAIPEGYDYDNED